MCFKQLKIMRIERRANKHGREELCKQIHRYFRLHRELLEDSVYKEIYDYYRATLIVYLKKDLRDNMLDDAGIGDLIDMFADYYNKKHAAENTTACRAVIDERYKTWQKLPDKCKRIRI